MMRPLLRCFVVLILPAVSFLPSPSCATPALLLDLSHPCDDAAANICDSGPGGLCFRGAEDNYACGCATGYYCSAHCGAHEGHKCTVVTASPTATPTTGPTKAPTEPSGAYTISGTVSIDGLSRELWDAGEPAMSHAFKTALASAAECFASMVHLGGISGGYSLGVFGESDAAANLAEKLGPPTPACNPCVNMRSPTMATLGKECGSWAWGMENKCNKDEVWRKEKYCQKACFDVGSGYEGDLCCRGFSRLRRLEAVAASVAHARRPYPAPAPVPPVARRLAAWSQHVLLDEAKQAELYKHMMQGRGAKELAMLSREVTADDYDADAARAAREAKQGHTEADERGRVFDTNGEELHPIRTHVPLNVQYTIALMTRGARARWGAYADNLARALNERHGAILIEKWKEAANALFIRSLDKLVLRCEATIVSAHPTDDPTAAPTSAPSRMPTTLPTGAPTKSPTGTPTRGPTASPSPKPTFDNFVAMARPTPAPTTDLHPAQAVVSAVLLGCCCCNVIGLIAVLRPRRTRALLAAARAQVYSLLGKSRGDAIDTDFESLLAAPSTSRGGVTRKYGAAQQSKARRKNTLQRALGRQKVLKMWTEQDAAARAGAAFRVTGSSRRGVLPVGISGKKLPPMSMEEAAAAAAASRGRKVQGMSARMAEEEAEGDDDDDAESDTTGDDIMRSLGDDGKGSSDGSGRESELLPSDLPSAAQMSFALALDVAKVESKAREPESSDGSDSEDGDDADARVRALEAEVARFKAMAGAMGKLQVTRTPSESESEASSSDDGAADDIFAAFAAGGTGDV